MNLGEYVNIVCTTVNRTDVDSKTACKLYVNRRYQMIYDAYPWRDSEIISDLIAGQPLEEGSQATVATELAFPAGIDRIVKVGLVNIAGGTRVITDLRPSDSAALMETRPDVLLVSGRPEFYEELNTDEGRVIRIYPAANSGSDYFIVVGKKVCAALSTDADSPVLRNIDNALIAFSIADMLKRDRHYAKADQQLKEAQELLKEAIALEQVQSNAPRAARPLSVTGGTLGELADAVASKLNLWDAASQIRIQEALRRNYQDLYDRELWTESIAMISMQAQGGILVLPYYIDRVIAIANQANVSVGIQELEYIFRTDPGLFDSDGSPVIYSILPPVAVAVLPETPQQLRFVSSNSNDSFTIYVSGEAGGQDRREIVNLSAGSGTSQYAYDTPLVISKPPSLGTLTVSGASSLIKYAEIPPEVSSRQHQRLWVQPIDAASANIYWFVLGKRKLHQLINAVDAVSVRGCEQALINMACAELAPPEQAAGFAAVAEQKIQTLIRKETNQQARRATVTPYTDRNDYTDSDTWLRG